MQRPSKIDWKDPDQVRDYHRELKRKQRSNGVKPRASIREWLSSKPGAFIAPEYWACIHKAQQAAGDTGNIEEFRLALWRAGYEPLKRGGGWTLQLPGPEWS